MKANLFAKSILKKYNIAYVPKSKPEDFIKLVKDIKNVENYCIAADSIPHITVCQFYYNPNKIESLWQEICSELLEPTLFLSFRRYSIVSFDNTIFWNAILPDQVEKLKDIFDIISKKVECIRKDDYDPHLTLFNYKNNDIVNKKEICIEDTFELILGESDEIGQLKTIILKINEKFPHPN